MTKTVQLEDICSYVTEKVSVNDVPLVDYVSTENLIADKGGLSLATNLPQTGKVTRYQKGDVLVSNIRPYFKKIWRADRTGGASNDVLVFRPTTDELSHDYLYYVLANDKFFNYSTASSGGSKMPRGDKVQIMKYPVYLPDLETQKKIADILGTIDEKIELSRKMNETLEQLGQALFRHYFIDNPEAEKWEELKIGELVNIKGGGTPSTKNPDFWNGDIAWTSPRDLTGKNDTYLLNTGKTITEQGLSKISSGLLPEGTLLLSSRAPIGYVAIAGLPLAINQGYIAFLPNGHLSSYFLYFWLKNNMERIKNAANGSTFMEISKSAFRNITTTKPDEEALQDFEAEAASLFDEMRSNQEQIQTLTTLRDTLLPRLISGKIKA